MKYLTKKFFCPANGWDCPYWKKDGSCALVDEGENPVYECDDAGYLFPYSEQDNPYVWETPDGERYDVQELLEQGYHFVNGEPVYSSELAPTMKTVAEILKSPPMGMETIEIRNPNFKSKYIKSWQVGEPLQEEDFYEED